MSIIQQESRLILKRSTLAGVVPTIPASFDHTDGTWLDTDIYPGEFFVNTIDDKVWYRGATVHQVYPALGASASQEVYLFNDFTSLPALGTVDTLYVTKDTSNIYYWNSTLASYVVTNTPTSHWSDIVDGPVSAPFQIDDAVTLKHGVNDVNASHYTKVVSDGPAGMTGAKVDKRVGYDLSQNDFTDAYKAIIDAGTFSLVQYTDYISEYPVIGLDTVLYIARLDQDMSYWDQAMTVYVSLLTTGAVGPQGPQGNTGSQGFQGPVGPTFNPGFTPEDVANKSNDTDLTADSSTLYPTQHAVKTYVDNIPRFAGPITDVTVTDDGTSVTISSVNANFYENSDFTGKFVTLTIPAITFAITRNTYYYVIASYNAGSPVYSYIFDNTVINHSNILNIVQVYREYVSGVINELHVFKTGTYGLGLPNKISHRLIHTQRFGHEAGLLNSVYGTRNLAIASGMIWYDGNEIALSALSSTTGGQNIHFYYHVGGVWTASLETQLNNTQYDDGTNLVTLSGASKYTVNWIYRSSSNATMYVLLGSADSTLNEAQASQPPALPDVIAKQAIRIGRIIFKKSIDTPAQVDSEFTIGFSPSGVFNHNDLANIQDAPSAVAGEHYHLSLLEATKATQLATTSQDGLLSSTDWNTFNNKPTVLSALTDVTISTPTNDQLLTYETSSGKWKNKTSSVVGFTYHVKGGGSNLISTAVALAHTQLGGTGTAVVVVEGGGADYIENTSTGIVMYSDVSIIAVGKPKIIRTVVNALYQNAGNVMISTDFNVTGDFNYSCDYGVIYRVGASISYIHTYYKAVSLNATCMCVAYQDNAVGCKTIVNKCTSTTSSNGFGIVAAGEYSDATSHPAIIEGMYVGSGTESNRLFYLYSGLDALRARFNNVSIQNSGTCVLNEVLGSITANSPGGLMINKIGGDLTYNTLGSGDLGTVTHIGILQGNLTVTGSFNYPKNESIIIDSMCKNITLTDECKVTINRYGNNYRTVHTITLGLRSSLYIPLYDCYLGDNITATIGYKSLLKIDTYRVGLNDPNGTNGVLKINSGLGWVLIGNLYMTGYVRTGYPTTGLDCIVLNGGNLRLSNSLVQMGVTNNVGTTNVYTAIHVKDNSKLWIDGTVAIHCAETTTPANAILVDAGKTLSVTNIGDIYSNTNKSVLGTYTELIPTGGTFIANQTNLIY